MYSIFCSDASASFASLPQCSLFSFSLLSCGPFLYFGSHAASLKWFFSQRCFSWFSLDSKNSDRTLIGIVRLVRSLADRTFQPRTGTPPGPRRTGAQRPTPALTAPTAARTSLRPLPGKFGGLVLGCIETKSCKESRTLQHLSRSTKFSPFCNAPSSKNLAIDMLFVKIHK